MSERVVLVGLAVCVTAAALLGACGGSGSSGNRQQEVTPSGDIPDTQPYTLATSPSGYALKVPEGWARTDRPGGMSFTDNLNAIRIDERPAPSAPDVRSVQANELTSLRASTPGFQLEAVQTVGRPAGPAILTRYRADGTPNPVTGKRPRLEVQRYDFWRNGLEVALTLSSPATADNVDPWRVVTESFVWQR